MKNLFTLSLLLFSFVAIQAEDVDIPLTNADLEDQTAMFLNDSNKWAITAYYFDEVYGPDVNFKSNESGLAAGEGIDDSQAFKAVVVQPDADANKVAQVVYMNTETLDISNREYGTYTFKVNIKTSNTLKGSRPFAFRVVGTDADGNVVTDSTTYNDTDAAGVINANSDFKDEAKIADFQPMVSVFNVFENSNVGAIKYIRFQLHFGKKLNEAALTSTYWIDNLSLTGPAIKSSAISDVASKSSISISPNPARDFAMVSSVNEIQHITIYNVLGKVQSTVLVNDCEHNLNVSNLASGMYLFSIKTNNGLEVVKFQKQ